MGFQLPGLRGHRTQTQMKERLRFCRLSFAFLTVVGSLREASPNPRGKKPKLSKGSQFWDVRLCLVAFRD